MEPNVKHEPIFFHIDVNSAFLSWSALKYLEEGGDVDLREIPSIVGGDIESRHGIVTAKSIPAKAYGIRTAETVVSAFQKCPTLVSVRPDHAYYKECSRKLMQFLADICPEIEQVSIDECYMSFEPIRKNYASPEEAAAKIKDSVYDTFGFTVNVGISNRKVLAKMASDFKKPNLVHTLYTHELPDKLWQLPVGSLHMCGKSSADLLHRMGINTIGDLAHTDLTLVTSWLKSHGQLLWEYANGIDDSVVEPLPAQAKGIGNSTTLAKNAETAADAYAVLKQLADSVSRRLKKASFLAGQISTEIKYDTFRCVSHQMILPASTSQAGEIYRYARQLFDELWDGSPVRLLGIRTTKLEEEGSPVQINLFDFQKQQAVSEKQKKLDDAIKNIRKRFGDDAISKGF